jgi:hypothetical protein
MMSSADLSRLINFCSGRARLPSCAADFPMNFKLTAPPPQSEKAPDDYLPIAQTCFFSLSLPRYSSTAVRLVWKTKLATFAHVTILTSNVMPCRYYVTG